MTENLKSGLLRSRALGLVVGILIVAAAGAASLDENRSRFLLSSTVARRELAESLRRFDHDLTDEEQQTLRSIDDRLNSLPSSQRDAYFAVLRRYHNWLDGLPERVRDGLLAKPADQRLAAIKPLIAKYPLPDVQTRSPVDFIQTGGTGVFEVASLCKTWLALSPEERKKVDAVAQGSRRSELHRLGRDHDIPLELKPADFDEAAWIARAEDRLKDIGGGGDRQKDWIAKLEARISESAIKRKESGKLRPRPFLHRLAVNLYVQEHTPPPAVDPGRLTQFFAATPSWVQSTFNAFPSEEARRRLTLIYRLIYPAPQEFTPMAPSGPKARAASPAAVARPGPPPRPAPSAPPAAPSATPPKTAAPF